MKKILKGTLTGLLLVTLTTPGFAENRQGAVTLSPFVGGYVLDKVLPFESRPMLGLRAGYNFTENIGAEAMFGYSLTETKRNMGSAGSKETDLYHYGVDVLYHFMPGSNFVPFVEVGGGVTHFKVPNTPSIGAPYYIGQVNYGAGFKYFVAPDVALRADVRHAILVADVANNNLEYAAGLTFNFGGVRPASKPLPECPPAVVAVTAKDTTGPSVTLATPPDNSVGAPVHGNLSIAFNEEMDPATINTKTVTLSQGKTVIPGSVTAPTSSTASYSQEINLQPDTLYTGKVTTGVKDRAGNALAKDYVWSFKTAPTPDPVATKTIIINKFVMLEESHFEYNKATLSKAGQDQLKLNVQIMKDNPDLKVRIAGYASASGTPEYNQGLSERRANTVKTYMITEGGIAPERLDTIGYGEARPAQYEANPAEYESAAAKANMRVLFEVIEK